MKTMNARHIQCDPENKVGRMRLACRNIPDADLVTLSERVLTMARDAMPVAADIAMRLEHEATRRDLVQARWNIRRMRRQIERADRLIEPTVRPAVDPDDMVEHYERWDSCC
jgi:hypothetical protein